MKRSELKVGDRLYHATAGNWKRGGGWGGSWAVTVLAVEPYKYDRYAIAEKRHHPVSKGFGVYVQLDNGTRDVVQLQNLRGPYDECKAIADGRAKAIKDECAARRKAFDDEHAKANRLIARAADVGLMVAYVAHNDSFGRYVVDHDTLSALLTSHNDMLGSLG